MTVQVRELGLGLGLELELYSKTVVHLDKYLNGNIVLAEPRGVLVGFRLGGTFDAGSNLTIVIQFFFFPKS